jgi:hypothetical protein
MSQLDENRRRGAAGAAGGAQTTAPPQEPVGLRVTMDETYEEVEGAEGAFAAGLKAGELNMAIGHSHCDGGGAGGRGMLGVWWASLCDAMRLIVGFKSVSVFFFDLVLTRVRNPNRRGGCCHGFRFPLRVVRDAAGQRARAPQCVARPHGPRRAISARAR